MSRTCSTCCSQTYMTYSINHECRSSRPMSRTCSTCCSQTYMTYSINHECRSSRPTSRTCSTCCSRWRVRRYMMRATIRSIPTRTR